MQGFILMPWSHGSFSQIKITVSFYSLQVHLMDILARRENVYLLIFYTIFNSNTSNGRGINTI